MTSLRINVVADRTRLAEAAVRKAAEAALGDAGEALLTEANRTVPLEEGTLQRTGTVSQDGLTVAVSYGGPYAVVQHEHTEFRHDPGRRAKWLQLTFQEQAQRVMGFVAQRIRGAVR